jgi:hypothetical protein
MLIGGAPGDSACSLRAGGGGSNDKHPTDLASAYSARRAQECRAECAGCDTCLFAKETAEIGGVGKAEITGDLLHVEIGVGQLTLRLARQSLVDDGVMPR